MSEGRKYTPGPDVEAGEVVHDSKGNRIDDAYIERAVEDVHQQLADRSAAAPDELADPLVREAEQCPGVSDGES